MKLKIGKKKLAKANETSVSFKSKGNFFFFFFFLNLLLFIEKKNPAIVVPEQSISSDKGEVTTSRNLTLKELLSQLKHYNSNFRKGFLFNFNESVEL